MVRKIGELGWRSPKVTAYEDEASLQTLIEQSPDLLPGSNGMAMAIVRELEVPATGYVDLVGIDPAGNITLVECKLKANPDIRRQVVGQVFAYAAGLWGLSYDEFDRLFSARLGGVSIVQRVKELGLEEWDEEGFRESLAANLAAGRFRLVIAVDEITDELKRIVRYLNQHTASDLQVVALELGYIADDGFEILVPAVYGEESIQNKKPAAGQQKWDETSVLAALEACCSPAGFQAARRLYEFAKIRGIGFNWGVVSLAAVTARFLISGKLVSVFSFYEWPKGKGIFSVNFEYIRYHVPPNVISRFAERLHEISGVKERFTGLEEADYKKRPSVSINEILTQPGAVETIESAVKELLDSQD